MWYWRELIKIARERVEVREEENWPPRYEEFFELYKTAVTTCQMPNCQICRSVEAAKTLEEMYRDDD